MPKTYPWRWSSQNPDEVHMGYASNSSIEDEYARLKTELESKTIKELREYFESIGGESDEIKNKTKVKTIKYIIKFVKTAAGNNNDNSESEGGAKTKQKTRRVKKVSKTRGVKKVSKTRGVKKTSFFGLF